MKASKKEIATFVLSSALFALAVSIGYFGYVLTRINANLPVILDELQVTQDKMGPIVDEVAEIRKLIPGIVAEVGLIRQEIPPIVAEVGRVREQIPVILDEVESVRAQIPTIMADVDTIMGQIPPILEEVAALRTETIPPILAEVESIRSETLPPIFEQVAEIKLLVPQVLDEVAAVRAEMPGYFDRADRLVSDAGLAGKKASEGAISGVFSGIVKAPFSLVTGLGNSVLPPEIATEEDIQLLQEAASLLLESEKKGAVQTFENPNTGVSGTLTLKAIRKVRGVPHKTMNLVARKDGKTFANRDCEVAAREDGTWELIKTKNR